jgi:hypothetical protein
MIVNPANARVDPLPASAADRRAALIARGAFYVHPFTADEGMDRLSAWAAAGRPIFVDFLTTDRDGSVGRELERRFRLSPLNGSAQLFQLFPPVMAASAH